ncbi:MAG: bifunctional demethylmenaquinone methyltransferase/2-methoxy-6-polyprenyl-1,4-benzoquinol methylase UbiE [Thermoleophilaceae bacterium]|nr:bifunctional demethylmenaquinone methyltransferase/2-methoxy-6-polyprenyl-1,4-benzoquinol methylase UbiE [Thermoleophilaceae bacterium]
MSDHEVKSGTLPEQQVRAMFDRIAKRYDLMNTVMTAGLHERWRRRAADLAELSPGDSVLDLATGTGDLAFELAGRVGPRGQVIGADFSPEMLAIARKKAPGKASDKMAAIDFQIGNALDLQFDDDTFDALTVGFGVRNFSDLDQGLREMARVVRPGGKVVILEISTPTKPPLSWFYSLWFDRIVPGLGRLGGEDSAYTYLPNSVKRFPAPATLAAKLFDAGCEDVKYVSTAGGIITIHHGRAR